MNTKDEIKRQIIAKVKETFSMYPVDVQTSPEDDDSLWVQVFCVPADQVLKLEDAIFNIQDALAPAGEILLLPMVKDMAITRQYYPEHMPKDGVFIGNGTCAHCSLFAGVCEQHNQPATDARAHAGSYQHVQHDREL